MPTGRGLVLGGLAAALGLSGLLFGVEEFVLAAVACASLLVYGEATVLVGARLARSAVVIRVEVPRRGVEVGDAVSAAVVVDNRGRWPSPGLVAEEAPPWRVSYPGLLGRWRPNPAVVPAPSGAGGGRGRTGHVLGTGHLLRTGQVGWRIGVLPPGASVSLPLALPTARRGLWSLGGIRLWCCDPLAVVAVPLSISPEAHVVVVPRPAPSSPSTVESADPAAPGHRGGGDAERVVAPGGDEFAGLRPYVAGDRLTRLHWPVMARTGELLVRDFVEPMEGLVEVHVDDRTARIEESVAQAATKALAALRTGAGVVVRTGAGERLVLTPGPAAPGALLRALAMVRALP